MKTKEQINGVDVWKRGDNGIQEYWYRERFPRYEIIRNFEGDGSWWVQDFGPNGDELQIIRNPFLSQVQVCFVEITDIPHAGEEFGDRPHHDTLPATRSGNIAWEDAGEAKAYAETLDQVCVGTK